MKRIILLLAAVGLVSVSSLKAQAAPQRKTMSLGVYEALVIEMPEAAEKLAGQVWTDFLKDAYDARAKYNRKTGEYLADDANIAGVGSPVDVYAAIEEAGEGSRLSLWIDMGAGSGFLSAGQFPDRYLEAEKLLMAYKQAVAQELVRLDLEAQEKALEGVQSELRKLEAAHKRYEDDIARAEEAIRKAREAIAQNETEQETTRQRIEAQQKLVEEVQSRLEEMQRERGRRNRR
jgi:hypothetical protein